MKLSDDRINQLSHQIAEAFRNDERIEFKTVFNSVRLAVRRSIGRSIRKDAEIEAVVTDKIISQKRNIIEGTAEWDALFWQYYEDELDRLQVLK